jgi:hypothetical protein
MEMVHFSDEVVKSVSTLLPGQKEIATRYTIYPILIFQSPGTTIEQFIINHKIERIKKNSLFMATEHSEIAHGK